MMVVGKTGCGKTTLIQALRGASLEYRKTQALNYQQDYIDTPGEFIEHRRFFSSLQATSASCRYVVLVQSASQNRSLFPPGFASLFYRPVIGVVTKCDREDADLQGAITHLQRAGARRIVPTSAYLNEGIDELDRLLYEEEV